MESRVPREVQKGGPTWWQVSTRAVHTKTPETPRANAVVRKSREVPWELFPMGSICSPVGTEDAEGTVGMAGWGLGCGQVADTRGLRAVPRSPEALVICRGEGGHGEE